MLLTSGNIHFEGDKNEDQEKEMKQEFGPTCDWIKKRLGDKVASVQISNRLSSSPCVLVTGKFGWSANMERWILPSAFKLTCYFSGSSRSCFLILGFHAG